MAPHKHSAAGTMIPRGSTPEGRMPGKKPNLIFFPATRRGMGAGHLMRSLQLMKNLGGRGYLFVDKNDLAERGELTALLSDVQADRIITEWEKLPADSFAIVDARATDESVFETLASRMPVVGIDEGGRRRGAFQFLIDTFPRLGRAVKPNIRVSPVQFKTGASITLKYPIHKVLISFGGEDPADLSSVMLQTLLTNRLCAREEITVMEGPLFHRTTWPEGVRVMRGCRNVAEIAGNFDLVFTHFGLSAYEVIGEGVPVILFNPSTYHRRISQKDCFPEIGVRKVDINKLKRFFADTTWPEKFFRTTGRKTDGAGSLLSVIETLAPQGSSVCPLCEKLPAASLARFAEKTYFRCPSCRLIWLVSWGRPREYGEDYFFTEYRAQYGKTYLQDFDNIKLMGEGRLRIIEKLLRPCQNARSRPDWSCTALLDIGAAFGPFLLVAQERGFAVEGIERSETGTQYIRDVLKLPCLQSDFESETIGVRIKEKSYDIITMWYVIEHLARLREVLVKVNLLLKPGGLFAFSTPSAAGISFRKNRGLFLEKSPADHFTLWTARILRKALARFGFRVRKIRVTGHHPERFFPGAGKKPISIVLSLFSKVLRLGDTFEVYAVKERDCR